jgi:hypothetical protein
MNHTDGNQTPPTAAELNEQIHAALIEHGGPLAVSGLIHRLTGGMKCKRTTLIQAILAIHECPGTWRIDIDPDNGQAIVGLDSQEKPEDPAAYLGLTLDRDHARRVGERLLEAAGKEGT